MKLILEISAINIFLLFVLSCGNIASEKNVARTNAPAGPNEFEQALLKLDGAVIDKDLESKIFQLRVLPQKSAECSMHQKRNLLFAWAMFEGKFDALEREYARMVDENLFEKTALLTKCRIDRETGARMDPDLEKFIHDHADFSAYLPSQSDKIINQIITFEKNIHDIYFGFRVALGVLNRELHNYEPEKGEEEKFDSANLVRAGFGYTHKNIEIEKLYSQALRAHDGHDVLIPIAIDLNSTDTIVHAVSLLIRRSSSGFDYIFMDPLNWKFLSHQNYKKVIDSIKRLVENPQYFKEALIRSGFFAAKRFGNQPGVTALALFSYVELLENLNLLDDAFFINVYKTPTCQLIKNLGDTLVQVSLKLDDKGSQVRVVPDARQELNSRFKCI